MVHFWRAKVGRFSRALKASVVVLPDNDRPGRDHAAKVASSLHAAGIPVRVLTLDGLPDGGDVYDWIEAHDGRTQEEIAASLSSLADAAPKWEPSMDASTAAPEIPEIVIGPDESRVISEALAALCLTDKTLYQWVTKLAHVVHDPAKPTAKKGRQRDPSAPRIVALPPARLRELLTTSARLVTVKPKKPKTKAEKDAAAEGTIEWETTPTHPPEWLVKGIEGRGEWPGIRPLRGVIETPALRPDGTILDVAGYDAATGLLYQPTADYPVISDRPTLADAKAAADALLQVVADFPFEKPGHWSGWLAAILTVLARPAFDGPAPLFLIDATTAGSGKGLLADCIAVIATGRDATKSPWPSKEDERQKLLTALALEGDPLVTFDNVTGELGGSNLDLALTSTTLQGRVLGLTKTTGRLPLSIVWLATGNNCELGPDTSRRVAHVRLASKLENPETRDGFAHPDLLAWVRQERPRLVAAALTILRAYVVAGRPTEKLPPWGSFTEWSDLVRQALVWVGQADPGTTRQELQRGADRERGLLHALMTGWLQLDPHQHGVTVAEAIAAVEKQRRERARDPNAPRPYPALETALLEMAPRGGDLPSSKSLGSKLRQVKGRVVDGRAFEPGGVEHGAALWRVAGDCGDCGDFDYSLRRKSEEEKKSVGAVG